MAEPLRTTLRSLHSNRLVTTTEKYLEIVAIVRKISNQEVPTEDLELMRDLVAECDSFLARKVQLLKDKGMLDFLPLAPGSAERIRRDARVENLILNYSVQAQLFAEVNMPKEAVARAQEGLVLCEKMGGPCSMKGLIEEIMKTKDVDRYEELFSCAVKGMLEEIIKKMHLKLLCETEKYLVI